MEKIVVLKRNNGDDNLVECLKMLFPECTIEVHESRPVKGKDDLSQADTGGEAFFNERLEKYLGYL